MFNKKLHFVQLDIQLLCYKDNKKYQYNANYTNEYYILVMFKGKAEIIYKDKIYIVKPGETFIANRKEKYVVNYGKEYSEYLEIRFLPRFFYEVDNQIDILKPFKETNQLKIYNKETKNIYYNFAVQNIIRALETKSSRAFVIGSVLQLICEIYYIYQNKHPAEIKETDSTFTKIVAYIDEHLFEKITLKSVAKSVYVSERCVTDTIRRICGESFHQLLNEKRLDQAEKLVTSNFHDLNKVAYMCGFDTYSTFYRAYKNRFGCSPKQKRDEKNKNKQL